MNRPLRRITSPCLLTMALPLTLLALNSGTTSAQVTVSQGSCPGDNMPCTTIVRQQGIDSPRLDVEGTPPSGAGQIAIVSSGAAIFGLQDEASAVKNEPYQAQAATEMKQTLADGSHIVQTTTATIARDSDGRTMRSQKLSTMGPWKSADSSQGNSQTLTTIFDPVAKEHIDFTSDNKVAHVLPMPPLPPGLPPGLPSGAVVGGEAGVAMSVSEFAPAPAGAMAQGFAMQTRRVVSPDMEQPKVVSPDMEQPKTESLGTKTIEGVQVTGTRTTSTIPAGEIGNDKALVITRETWYSPELKLVIQSTQSDPRFGETTYSLTNIQRVEPDTTLFKIPADYKIDKVVPRMIKAPPQ